MIMNVFLKRLDFHRHDAVQKMNLPFWDVNDGPIVSVIYM